jgi:hypothetical protein
MKTANEMFREAFDQPRDKRSPEYEPGVLAALKFGLERAEISTPFPEGTAASDAYYAGFDEGHRRWSEARAAGKRHGRKTK